MIGLRQTDWGRFDLVSCDGAESSVVRTLIYTTLFTDQRAPAAREADGFAARGWWAKPQAGSGLWHVRRQGLGAAAKHETIVMVQDALALEPALRDVTVTDATPPDLAGVMTLSVAGLHNGQRFVLRVDL